MYGDTWAWLMLMPILFIGLMVWSIIWKGMALWKAARNGSKGWFIALLIINTVGILEIIYIYFIAGKKDAQTIAPSN